MRSNVYINEQPRYEGAFTSKCAFEISTVVAVVRCTAVGWFLMIIIM